MSRREPPGQDTVRLKASEPEDLLALVPYLIGFHPRESLVAVLLQAGRVAMTARVDLPAVGSAPAVAAEFDRAASRQGGGELVLVGYAADGDAARVVVEVVSSTLESVRVIEAMVVDGERWWSLMCSGPCCPTEGRPYDLQAHPMAVQAVVAGLSTRADRADVEALVAGPPVGEHIRLQERARVLRSSVWSLTPTAARAEIAGLVRRAVDTVPPDEDELLRLAWLARDIGVRDVAWALITRQEAEAHLQLWLAVVAVAPRDLAPGPLGLAGLAGWMSGSGVLLNCCADRLADIAPRYSLGRILDQISAAALPPSFADDLATDLRRELVEVVDGAAAPLGCPHD